MAASQVKSVGGYRCEFIDPVSDDFICKVCNCVAREPNLTSCCGQHYCQSCIVKIIEDGKPCPNPECGEATFNTFLDKNYHRKILSLRVHCTVKDRGCQWIGKVEQLDTHMDVNSGDCQYVDIECPEKCGQQVQKHQLATHIVNECLKRDFTCMYCGFKATYEVVSEKHWPECQNYPLPCPNRCQIGAVERNTLEDHLNICHLQVVDCDFSYAGCNEKLQRQDMENHIEKNAQKHLALIAAASMKLSQDFEQKLQEQRDIFQEQLHLMKQDLQQKDTQIQALNEEMIEMKTQIGKLQDKLQSFPPFLFTLSNFTELKETMKSWDSPPMYTHPCGYKFCIVVFPHGDYEGRQTHVSVCIRTLPGKFDATLQWPAKFTITLQLLNQHRDQDHITVTKELKWKTPNNSIIFKSQFIGHANLEWDSEKLTQYLKDDCLKFRVTRVGFIALSD